MKKHLALLVAALVAVVGLTTAPASAGSRALPIDYGLTQTASCSPPAYPSTSWTVTFDRNPNNGQVILRKIKWNPSGSGMSLSDLKTSNQGSYQIGSGGPFSVTGSWVNSFTWTGETRFLVLGNCKTATRTVT